MWNPCLGLTYPTKGTNELGYLNTNSLQSMIGAHFRGCEIPSSSGMLYERSSVASMARETGAAIGSQASVH